MKTIEQNTAAVVEPNVIPVMVHPLSRAWDQPLSAEILVDDEYALMSERSLERLHDYSSSIPSGVYEGKMWKRSDVKTFSWLLCWYGPSADPNRCSINVRKIITV